VVLAHDIDDRKSQIKAQIEETTNDCEREKLLERLAKLADSVAVINVGAATEVVIGRMAYGTATACFVNGRTRVGVVIIGGAVQDAHAGGPGRAITTT
jgi:hypothetical protein